MKVNSRSVRLSILIIWAVICIMPISWIFSTAFKPNEEATRFPPTLIPNEATLDNFSYILNDEILFRSILNSLFVSIAAAVLCVVISALAGYAFSRYQFKGKNLLMGLLLGSFLIPPVVNIVPIYVEFSYLFRSTNSLLQLIVVYQLLILPLNVFLFKNYFDTIPLELEESALVDGCYRFQAFYKIALPLSAPAIVASAIFAFRFAWDEFIFALTFISSPDKSVFAAAIYNFVGLYEVQYGYLAAAIVIMCVPPIIILALFQRQIITGLKMGGVRG
ncbi:MAG: carbohydrate ABC transporter permease [Dehalococcoidia bacterium]|nr:carbohydrate ABC transporter permease [Dehalococcoidia bacterium]